MINWQGHPEIRVALLFCGEGAGAGNGERAIDAILVASASAELLLIAEGF
jgi:hypothetical protein